MEVKNINAKYVGKYIRQSQDKGIIVKNKKMAIKLYMEENSGRAVGRILGISKNKCLHWIRKYAQKIEKTLAANSRVEVIEMDELFSFVERKKQIYIMILVSRDKQKIVGYDIAFDRSKDRIQKLNVFFVPLKL